jgi:4-amino-4-deoxy-L-arabinose transferase-like glycosyltransferase
MFVITILAVTVRVVYVLVDRKGISFGGDAYFYHEGANLLAQGHGFIEPYFYHLGRTVQAAEHPPLYVVFLAVPSTLGFTSTLTHLLWSCTLGTATVVVVGLLGRSVTNSARAGLIAAVIAALYPNLWIPDGSLEAETAAMLMTALAVFLAYRALRRPTWPQFAAVGLAVGAATLARSELILLLPLLVLPLACWTRDLDLGQRLQRLALAGLAAIVVIAPWSIFNVTRFKHPIYLSAQFDALLASANCNDTYSGRLIGYFSVSCAAAAGRRYHVKGDQSEQAIGYRRAALDYIRHHEARLPVVIAARLGRTLELYRPGQNLQLREYLDRVEKSVARAALLGFAALALLSVVGAIIMRRRRVVLFPLIGPIAIVIVTVVVTYASERFRTTAEVMLVVLAAVAIDQIASRASWRPRAIRDRSLNAPSLAS